jgi:hypothetical protein
MRNFLLLIISFLAITAVSAQTAVIVNSPPSIAGAKIFGVAQFGADLASDTWTGDAALADDGTAPNPNDACEALVNTGDLDGKVVLIDRGNCEFGFKCLAAENAGALAVIIVNNAAGGVVQDMGPGAVGAQVTIPCVLISLEDGAAIKAELANGPVNITLGAIVFDNNISIDINKVLAAPYGTVPKFEVGNGKFVVTPGGVILNKGVNEATNATIEATIERNGSTVYSEADVVDPIISGDTSELVLLPAYEPPAETGYYTINYEITFDNDDESAFDNTVSNDFYISENVFSKARWDETNSRPARTSAYSRGGGGSQLFFSGFEMTEATGTTLDSVRFYISSDSLFGNWNSETEVRVYAWLWDDINGDSVATSDEFATVAFNTVDLDPNLDEQWVTTELLDFETFDGPYTIVDDNVRVFFGVRFEAGGPEAAFIGFDEGISQTQLDDNELFGTYADIPYFQTNTWDPDTGVPGSFGVFVDANNHYFGAALATALYVTPMASNTQEPLLENVTVNIYPNPAIDRFTAEVELPAASKFIEYTVRDASGRLLFNARRDNVQMDKAEFNVSALPAGQYFLMVRTENGVASYPVSVQR